MCKRKKPQLLTFPWCYTYALQGICQGSSVGNEISSWIDTHKGVVIGIASAVGGLLVLSILFCCVRRYRRSKRLRRSKTVSPNLQLAVSQQQQWVPPAAGWGPGWQRAQGQPAAAGEQGLRYGGQSVRYA